MIVADALAMNMLQILCDRIEYPLEVHGHIYA